MQSLQSYSSVCTGQKPLLKIFVEETGEWQSKGQKKTKLLPDQVIPGVTPDGWDQNCLLQMWLITHKWHMEFWVKVGRKTITQTDKNTPKPAAKPLAGPVRHGAYVTLVKRFWTRSSCDIMWQEWSVFTGLSLSGKSPFVPANSESSFSRSLMSLLLFTAQYFLVEQTEGGHMYLY